VHASPDHIRRCPVTPREPEPTASRSARRLTLAVAPAAILQNLQNVPCLSACRPLGWQMGRTPTNLDEMFAAADQNGEKLTPSIFEADNGADLMTYGNAQRRYKQYRSDASAGGSGSTG
jgi:hypothetical protein